MPKAFKGRYSASFNPRNPPARPETYAEIKVRLNELDEKIEAAQGDALEESYRRSDFPAGSRWDHDSADRSLSDLQRQREHLVGQAARASAREMRLKRK